MLSRAGSKPVRGAHLQVCKADTQYAPAQPNLGYRRSAIHAGHPDIVSAGAVPRLRVPEIRTMQTILFPVCETDLSSVLPQYGLKAGLCSSAGGFRRAEFSRALSSFLPVFRRSTGPLAISATTAPARAFLSAPTRPRGQCTFAPSDCTRRWRRGRFDAVANSPGCAYFQGSSGHWLYRCLCVSRPCYSLSMARSRSL